MRSALLCLLVLASPTLAQAPLARADAALASRDWRAAAAAYEAALRADSTLAGGWFGLGQARVELRAPAEALRAFQAAARHRFAPPAVVQLAIARTQVLLGEREAAMATLAGLANNGFRQATSVTSDTVLRPLLTDDRMAPVLARMERNAAPCRYAPEARQFDFWIGQWDVYGTNGQQLGENRIEEHLNGCMLLENWTGGLGGSGKSINFFDPGEKTWRQVWVADAFSALDYTAGEYRDGAMRFTGRTKTPAGEPVLQKLTFFNVSADTVRQVFESSRDGGQTWREDWVGIYVRRK